MAGINVNWKKYDFSGLSDKERYSKKSEIIDKLKKEQGIGDTSISADKAKRLGVTEDQRHNLTQDQLSAYEAKSGDYITGAGGKSMSIQNIEENAAYRAEQESQVAAQQQTTKMPVDRPLIDLTTKGTIDLTTGEEQKRIGDNKIFQLVTSWKTTLALGTVLAGLGAYAALTSIGAAAAGTSGGTAVITRTATTIGTRPLSITTQRAFIGKSASNSVDKIFHAVRPVAARFATNAKSSALTKAMLLKRGVAAGIVGFIGGAFGTYPFAHWAKQEVLSGLKINSRDAREAGDFETAEAMLKFREEVAAVDWHDMIPYENLLHQFKEFFKADKMSIESERALIAKERGEIAFEGMSEGEKIAQRDIEQQAQFESNQASIESASAARRETSLKDKEEESKRYEEIREENKKADIEEMAWKAEYYNLIRDKKYEEAEELLKLKGGEI